jgi:hypothetical protein
MCAATHTKILGQTEGGSMTYLVAGVGLLATVASIITAVIVFVRR